MKSSERTKRKGGVRRGKYAVESTTGEQALPERVAQKAYELYEKRGHAHGCDVEDWLEAERLVVEQLEDQRSVKRRAVEEVNRSKENDATEKR